MYRNSILSSDQAEGISIFRGDSDKPLFLCVHARTLKDRMKGLLGTDELQDGRGILIEPCNSVHTFGMKYCLDIVYLDRKKKVLKCIKSMGPGRVSLSLRARFTIELQEGAISRHGIKTGDVFHWDYV